jgi:hypothetical protein
VIGTSRSVSLVVEQGKVTEFWRAIGVRGATDDRTTAPVTFPAVIEHYGPTVVSLLTDAGVDIRRILHGSERITYPNGPLHVGDRVAGTMTVTDVADKRGSSGPMRIVTVLIDLHHQDGRPAASITRTFVVLGG